jgi:hypothetical protein
MKAVRSLSSIPSFARRSRKSNRARMLAVERGDKLSGIEVWKRDDLDFRKAVFILDPRGEGAHLRLVDAPPQDRRDIDLHLHAVGQG